MKVILLFSGGLDSVLSYFLLKKANYEVKPIQFYMPFLSIKDKNEYIKNVRKSYNINLELIDISEEYLKILFNPQFGYGKNFNPCVDCKILFLKKAKEIMEKKGFNLIATGEVPGQRPFSQQRNFMNLIEKKAGVRGILLRPLAIDSSELNVEIDKSKFLNISGRNRKIQLKLAKKYKIDPIPSPGGGCLLTDPGYCKKLEKLFFITDKYKLSPQDFEIIKCCRVILNEKILLIVGRNKGENFELVEKFNSLSKETKLSCKIFKMETIPSPVIVALGEKFDEINLKRKVFELYKKYTKEKYHSEIEKIFNII